MPASIRIAAALGVVAALVVAVASAAAPARRAVPPPPQQLAGPLLVAPGAERPVELAALAIATEVEGGLARTTVEMRFHNPNARVLEGQLSLPLAPGQQIGGFALDVAGHMRAAVPVPRQKGQEVFEAVERRGIDPGLLEHTAGNQFRLRIYPIPADGERRVRIAIDEALQREGDDWVLRLPLGFARGLARVPLRITTPGQVAAPRLAGLALGGPLLRRGDAWAAELDGRSLRRDPVLGLRVAAAQAPQVLVQDFAGERYFHAWIPLSGPARARPLPRVIGLLWDSSGSARARDIDGELALLDRYFAAVGDAQVRLVRLRDVAEPERRFVVRHGDWSALRSELRATVYDGASALADWTPQPEVDEYLLFSDGMGNYGTATQMPTLAPRQRLFAIDSAGAAGDAARLAAWAEARGGRLIAWHDRAGLAAAGAALLHDGPRLLTLAGTGTDALVAASHDPQAGLLRVAGRLRQHAGSVTAIIDEGGSRRRITLPIRADAVTSPRVASLWAAYTLAALAADPARNEQAMLRLGARFGLVGPQTSLIVLESAADYVRYDIAPPAELQAEVERLSAASLAQLARDDREQLARVRAQFAERVAWWQTPWPKDRPLAVAQAPRREAMAAPASARELMQAASVRDAAAPAPAPAVARAEKARAKDSGSGDGAMTEPRIALQPWSPGSAFAKSLRQAPTDRIYALYLRERDRHPGSAAFFLDVAGVLFERGQRTLALRVLSNLAEMDLANRQLLRALGYRLMEAGAFAQAVAVFERVRALAGNEPQSWRDLALADAAAGREQAAVDNLWHVVATRWDARFPSIEMISLGELDALLANARTPLDARAIPADLRRNLPLDLRVVLGWDTDNTDIDLWVTDPDGERTYYGSPHSRQGGWLSHDCTQGYGPEEFILRHAKPGKYVVQANFFGDRQQLVTGATSLQLHLFTGFGTARQKDQRVTLRLAEVKGTILVGQFEVR